MKNKLMQVSNLPEIQDKEMKEILVKYCEGYKIYENLLRALKERYFKN